MPIDATVEVASSKLSSEIVDLAHQHIRAFPRTAALKDHEWDDVVIAPVARYIHDPASGSAGAPAYVEFRITSAGRPAAPRGYILVSLTHDDYPIPEFATLGDPKSDWLVNAANGASVHKLVRFAPGYIVAENAAGAPVAALGTRPLAAGSLAGSPAGGRRSAPSYAELKADYATHPARLDGRARRARRTAAAWRVASGVRNPTLALHVAETRDFAVDKHVVAVTPVAARPVEIARLQVLPAGGFRATGVTAGNALVRVEERDGTIDHYTIAVTPPATAITTRDLPVETLVWIAGTDWDGDQRQYNQLKRPQWCPFVGCGPTALAMMLGWWDVNGVPGAFYRLTSGKGDAKNFRFQYESLRDPDAPKNTADDAIDDAFIVPVYDDLYKLSHTFCWGPVSEQGTTNPDQLISAFQEYLGRITKALPAPMNEHGDRFVKVTALEHGHVTAPGFGETDWENGGKKVARGIQHGAPGVVGVGSWAGDLHYPLAYGYIVVVLHAADGPVEIGHYFKCNMGHGYGVKPEFHHAEDVWFGLTAQLQQIASPRSADDTIAATFTAPDRASVITRNNARRFQISSSAAASSSIWTSPWSELANGVFRSGPAACVSADGKSLHLFGRGDDDGIWRAHSPDGGATWDLAWAPIGAGTFTSCPAAVISADGRNLHVFGRGTDDKIWRAFSHDGGGTWDLAWAPIGVGTFASGPAAALSADGHSLHVFGRGKDDKIWRAFSHDGGSTWDLAWAPIGAGTFASGPAASLSADGQRLHVFGRGLDDRIWTAFSHDGGSTWDLAWAPIGDGVFFGSPAVAMAPDGNALHVFGVGKDLRVWRAFSSDGGGSWPFAWLPIDGATAH